MLLACEFRRTHTGINSLSRSLSPTPVNITAGMVGGLRTPVEPWPCNFAGTSEVLRARFAVAGPASSVLTGERLRLMP